MDINLEAAVQYHYNQFPPDALRASIGLLFEFSWTSENNLPKDPVVWSVIAIIPASGPIPNTQTNRIAKIISGTPLKNSSILLIVKKTRELGDVFFAAKKLKKSASVEPIIVARRAILKVSKSNFKYLGRLKYQYAIEPLSFELRNKLLVSSEGRICET